MVASALTAALAASHGCSSTAAVAALGGAAACVQTRCGQGERSGGGAHGARGLGGDSAPSRPNFDTRPPMLTPQAA